MSNLSRRKLVVTGLAATAGISALGVAASLAQKVRIHPRLTTAGSTARAKTLTYASLRLLTKHSLAREFSRNQISKRPLANEVAPFVAPLQ